MYVSNSTDPQPAAISPFIQFPLSNFFSKYSLVCMHVFRPLACWCHSQYQPEKNGQPTPFSVHLLANVSYGGTQMWVISQDDGKGNFGNYLPKSSPYYPKTFDPSTGDLPPYVYIPGCTFPLNSTAALAGTWLADSGTFTRPVLSSIAST